MKRFLAVVFGTVMVVALTVPLAGCPCGFDCSDDSEPSGPALLNLGVSTDVFTDAKAVVITISSLRLIGSGTTEDVFIDTFDVDGLGLSDADTVQLDLLQYPALNQLLLVTAQEIEPGDYAAVSLAVLDGDVNLSSVLDNQDQENELNVANGELRVEGFNLGSGPEAFTITFSLARALQVREASDDYLLTATGARVTDNESSASIAGRLAGDLFNTVTPCDEKTDPEKGNRLYLYKDLDEEEQAVDAFTAGNSNEIPDLAVAPYAMSSPTENSLSGGWEYAFGFLPAGQYTLRFTCAAESDDPIDYDGLIIPLPEDQEYSIDLTTSEAATCDIEVGASCS